MRPFGNLLKAWRTARRYSQLELASETQVSQRHSSFLESGRANPSREMVMHLAQELRVPLRERNDLLVAAGFAPCCAERALGDEGMAAIRQALEITLHHHEPFPALVVNRQWNIVLQNAAVDRSISLLGAGGQGGRRERSDPLLRHWAMRAATTTRHAATCRATTRRHVSSANPAPRHRGNTPTAAQQLGAAAAQ